MTVAALLLVDIQNDHFPDGAMELVGMIEATEKASGLLEAFLKTGQPVARVRHLSIEDDATFFLPGTEGCEPHPSVAPEPGEPVIEKNYPNGFRDTHLEFENLAVPAVSANAAFMVGLADGCASVIAGRRGRSNSRCAGC